MTVSDKTTQGQTDTVSFEVDLRHPPEKVWRALTEPALLARWLLPTIGFELTPGAAFTLKTQPYPGWDGTVDCRMLAIEQSGFRPEQKQNFAGARYGWDMMSKKLVALLDEAA